jgi:AGCS family alanine or glycine:cation symporter
MNLDKQIESFFQPVSEAVSSVIFFSVPVTIGSETLDVRILLLWLFGAAVFFTLYLGFVNIRGFKHAINLAFSKPKDTSNGQISSFQALTASLSGTVGLGNIAGVAVAISVGGPGAMLWMIVMGALAMSTKFAEVMLAVKYRTYPDKNDKTVISGGPMYYLRAAFEKRGLPRLGIIVAGIFAFACMCGSIGGGNMFQANQAFYQVMMVSGGEDGLLGGKGWLFGLGLAVLVGIVIIGGIKSIAAVTTRLVPMMGAIYLIAGLIVIGMHIGQLDDAVMTILKSAFSMEAGIGGILGGVLVGVQRAAFSNEAGLGSAAIVHSAAQTDSPVSQGLVAMLGPFIDTIVICSVTALVIVITGVYQGADGIGGVELTSQAFASGISWFPYVLALTVFLFAYSTLITWAYYGVKSARYLFGENKIVEFSFKLAFCLCIIVGASVELKSLINFSDAMILGMAFPNILGLYLLAPEIKKDLKEYFQGIENK